MAGIVTLRLVHWVGLQGRGGIVGGGMSDWPFFTALALVILGRVVIVVGIGLLIASIRNALRE